MAHAPAPPKPKPRRQQLARAARPTLSQQAQAELDPLIAAISGAANKKAAAAEAAIKGYTDSYAHQLAGMDAGAPYSGAEQQQAAVDSSLRQALTGGGNDLASQLASRLSALQGSSGAGALGQEGQALASQGESAGNTRLASGSAALSALLGEHAAASSFSKKLPGLAKLSGLQGLKQAEGNAQQEIGQGTIQAEGQLPSIVQQLRSARQARAALNSENAYRAAELGQGQQRIGIEAQNAATSRYRAQVSAQQGAERLNIEAHRAAQTAINENRSYQVSLARLGISKKDAQIRWMTAQAKLNNGGFTPNELHGLQVQANQIAGDAMKHSAGLPQLMHTMALNDIPPSLAIKAAKMSGYQPGKAGMFSGFAKGLAQAGAGADMAATSTAARAIVGLARQYIGTPYQWGGESPKGFDCSGFAQFLYGKSGIRIPRTTYTQWQAGHAVPHGQLQPGDLVFFRGSDSKGGLPGHVGVYIGNGKMIDAPHTGSSVRIESIDSFGGYMGARRYGR
jgi:cell wall-associated NlpC family hydrolase